MSGDWYPEDWREMDAFAVRECLKDNDRRICVEGQEWIRLIPTPILVEVMFLDERPASYEGARRIEAAEARIGELESELAMANDISGRRFAGWLADQPGRETPLDAYRRFLREVLGV